MEDHGAESEPESRLDSRELLQALVYGIHSDEYCVVDYTLNRRNTTAFRPWIRAVTQ